MCRPSVLAAALGLALFSFRATVVACPWVPPTDPCLPEGHWEVSEDQTVEAAPDLAFEAPSIERGPSPPPLPCEEVSELLQDPRTRSFALERVAAFSDDLDRCPHSMAAFGAALRAESDDFLVYRVLIAIGSDYQADPGPQVALLAMLQHASADVRWLAAVTLARSEVAPRVAERIVAAQAAERDPWVRLALAQGSLEHYPAESRAALVQLVHEDLSVSPLALSMLAQQDDRLGVLLEALQRSAPLRATALDFLVQRAEESPVQEVLLQVLEHGSDTERVQAAMGLLVDEAAVHRDRWQQLVGDARLPLRLRAVMVLEAGDALGWRSLACEAKLADAALAGEVARLLADQNGMFDAFFDWRIPFPERTPHGWIQGKDGAASVRCASRPLGGPAPGGTQRIPVGAYFSALHRFEQDGVAWLADWAGVCWVRADALNGKSTELQPAETPLEADISLQELPALDAALAAGDLELFDETAGFAGIRLRSPTREQRVKWMSGETGRFQVLASIEAQARQREAERERPLSSAQNR